MADLEYLANEARMLLGNPVLRDAFDSVDRGVLSQIRELRFGTPEGEIIRDKLMLTLQVVQQIREQLQDHIENLRFANVKAEE